MAVDTRILKQIKNTDPQQRRKAIIALADSRDLDALKPLQEIEQGDPEPKLRELATKAQKHLKEQMDKMAAFAANPEAYRAEMKVSERDVARAKSYMEEAMSTFLAKDNAKATKALIKALKANPTLKTDSYFLSLVGSITGKADAEGLNVLMDGQARSEFINTAEQGKIQKRKNDHRSKAEEIGWSAVGFDLTVFAMVIAVITFLAPFVFVQLINNAITYQGALTPDKYEEEFIKVPTELSTTTASVEAVGAVGLLVVAVVAGVGSAVSMFLFGLLVHVIATRLLGGNGTLPFMLSQLIPFYSLTTPIFFIWWCVIMVMISIGAGLIGMLCAPIMGLASFVVYFKAAGRIGSAYDFGALKGCLSMTIASFALSLLSSGLSYLLANTILTAAFGAAGA